MRILFIIIVNTVLVGLCGQTLPVEAVIQNIPLNPNCDSYELFVIKLGKKGKVKRELSKSQYYSKNYFKISSYADMPSTLTIEELPFNMHRITRLNALGSSSVYLVEQKNDGFFLSLACGGSVHENIRIHNSRDTTTTHYYLNSKLQWTRIYTDSVRTYIYYNDSGVESRREAYMIVNINDTAELRNYLKKGVSYGGVLLRLSNSEQQISYNIEQGQLKSMELTLYTLNNDEIRKRYLDFKATFPGVTSSVYLKTGLNLNGGEVKVK